MVAQFPRLERARFTISKEVTDILRWRIIDGSIPPGSRLTEESISTDMGISRGPVREALRDIENEGLVTVEPYKGAVVVELSSRELTEVLMPVRWILEEHAMRVLLAKLDEATVDRLEALVEAMRRAAEDHGEGQIRELVELDIRFHRAIFEASGEFHTEQLWLVIQPRIRVGFYQLSLEQPTPMEIADEHAALLDVMKTRDVDATLAVLRDHVVDQPSRLLEKSIGSKKDKTEDPMNDENETGRAE